MGNLCCNCGDGSRDGLFINHPYFVLCCDDVILVFVAVIHFLQCLPSAAAATSAETLFPSKWLSCLWEVEIKFFILCLCVNKLLFFSCTSTLPYLNPLVVSHLIFLSHVHLGRAVIEELGGHLVFGSATTQTCWDTGSIFPLHTLVTLQSFAKWENHNDIKVQKGTGRHFFDFTYKRSQF